MSVPRYLRFKANKAQAPALFVMAALAGHLLLFRKLARGDDAGAR